jgi:hypothetical protein
MIARVTPDGRGISLDKSLAWTMLGGLLVVGFWFGTELSGIKSDLAAAKETQAEFQAEWAAQAADRALYRRETDVRLRSLERDRAVDDQRLTSALQLLERIDARLERIEQQSRSVE